MKLDDLFEGAENDLNAAMTAQDMSYEFARWLTRNNEDTPLGELGMYHMTLPLKDNIEILALPAERAEIPYDNLYLCVGWTPDGSEPKQFGFMAPALDEYGNTKFYAVVMVRDDPRKDVDVAYKIRWTTMTHELTHFLDYQRGFKNGIKGNLGQRKKTGAEYYNDSLELNAHFQQGLAEMIQRLAHMQKKREDMGAILGSFQSFLKWALPYMPKSYHLYLTPENKKKLQRRLYKLYVEIKDKWPNLDVVQQYLATY